jgi:phosphatidylglycerophosphate synthase
MTPDPLHRQLYTVPNLITLVRPVSTLPFVWLCAQTQPAHAVWPCWSALLLFVMIICSDVLDGWLARRLNQASALGRALDHICDVLFILAALGFFVSRGLVPWWLPVAIVWAFILYAVDSWCHTAGQSQRTLLASRVGHLGGILYYVTVAVVTANLCGGNRLLSPGLLHGWFLSLALLALLSGAERLWLMTRVFSDRLLAGRAAGNLHRSIHSEP